MIETQSVESAKVTDHDLRFVEMSEPVEFVWGCMFWGDGYMDEVGVTGPKRFPFVPEYQAWYCEELGVGITVENTMIAAGHPKNPEVKCSVYLSPKREDVTLFSAGFLAATGFSVFRSKEWADD